MTQKVNKRLGLLKRIRSFLPLKARLVFYNSLVLPVFDYADLIWGDNGNITLMEDLQILQNKAAKIIIDHQPSSSASNALQILNWKPLFYRRLYHRCSYVFKCLNNLTDHDIHFSHNSDYHEYNTTSKNKLRLPKVRNWGEYRVCYHAISDWNNLDDTIKCSETLNSFKSYFFKSLNF